MDSASLGRSDEISALEKLMAADTGAARTLIITGAPGLGKSTLLDELASRASDCTVLRCNASEFEAASPYSALHQLLKPRLSLGSSLPAPLRASLETAFGSRPGRPDQLRLGLAALALLGSVKPTLCLIDNAQWLDETSAHVLALVARRLYGESVVIVFAARPDHQLFSLHDLPSLSLSPLSEAATRRLLSTVLPIPLDECVKDQIVAESRGVPAAIATLAAGIRRPSDVAGGYLLPAVVDVPAASKAAVEASLSKLSYAARTLALLAAADPTGDPVLLWRAAGDLSVSQADAVPLLDRGLLDIGARVRFQDPLFRPAIYQRAEPAARRAAHAALAAATTGTSFPERRAWHLGQSTSGPDAEVSLLLESTAPTARRRGGVAAAAAFYERSAALAEDPARRFALTMQAAVANSDVGDLDAAAQLSAAARLHADTETRNARVDAFQACVAFSRSRRPEAAGALLSAARRWATRDPAAATIAYSSALVAAYLTGESTTGTVCPEELVLDVTARDRPVDVVLPTLANALSGERAAVVPAARASLASLRDHADDPDQFDPAWAWIVGSLAWDDEALHDITERQLAAVRRVGRNAALPMALTSRALVHLQGGALDQAAQCVAEARGFSTSIPILVELGIAAWRGDRHFVARTRDELCPADLQELDPRHVVGCVYAELVLHNSTGNHAAALAAFDAHPPADEPGFHGFVPPELIEAAVRQDRMDQARKAFDRLRVHAVTASTPWALGIERRCSALVGDPADAESRFAESVHYLEGSRARLELARTQLLFGEWLRRRQRRGEAREYLRPAYKTFAAAGAELFANRAARELRAAGISPPQPHSTSGTLTAQEYAIAERVAEGKTSKEVAGELVLSPRTVDAHLRNIFAKLEIKSRREIRGALEAIRRSHTA
ncbi:AAA family ATPase [Mycolicibacterium goodii]|uniref:helix-turn-helix transcriptional regulator n=1 Tax=Mycolicibacterium goodii TaxID=134601 RepID=UPI001F0446F1|nr:AAA family ATPase [Mycolicibacterium goodii]ULN49480.1 AAA family ATPase [Mycolicibacterium goodii]